jgi:hypothetical protein
MIVSRSSVGTGFIVPGDNRIDYDKKANPILSVLNSPIQHLRSLAFENSNFNSTGGHSGPLFPHNKG